MVINGINMKDISQLSKDIQKFKKLVRRKLRTDFGANVSNDVVRMAVDNFAKHGFDRGETLVPWQPLAASTAKEKLRRHRGKVSGILVDSGSGRKAVAHSRRPAIWNGNNLELHFVIAAHYMKYHNEGIPGRLPKREFLGASPKIGHIATIRLDQMFQNIKQSI